MKTRCLIVDDEPLARDLIRRYIQKIENLNLVAECHNAVKAFEKLQQQKIDLMFMDIQMPQISGIDFLKTLKNPPGVIVTTAHQEYALNGFELDVVDFLLKPVSFQRFLKALNKYYRFRHKEPVLTENGVHPVSEKEESIYLRENRKMTKVFLDEILYIEGLSEYVQVYTKNKKLVTKATLSGMENKLPTNDFLRVHKSYIIALNKIEAFTTSTIEIGGKELPIGRSYKNNVLEKLNAASASA